MTRASEHFLGTATCVAAAALALVAGVALAAPGAFDPTFDSDGLLLTSLAPPQDRSSPVAVQPDDRIVVAGTTAGAGGADFAVARYNRDGTPDTAFSGDGIQAVPIEIGRAHV